MEQKVKCNYCGEELTLKKLSEPCPYCGEKECWVDSWGENVCLTYVDGEEWVDINYGSDCLCRACEERFPYYASSLTLITPELLYKAEFDEGLLRQGLSLFGEQPYLNELDDEFQTVIKGIVKGATWIQTDPWRGYTQTPREADGWSITIDGWHSSMEKSPFSESVQSLARKDLDFPVAIVISRTSNVCALGVSLYCRKNDRERLLKMVNLNTRGVGGIHEIKENERR